MTIRPLEDYRQEVREAAALHRPEDPTSWMEEQIAWLWFSDDVDADIQYQTFRDSLPKDGETRARRLHAPIERENCHG